MNFSLAIFVCLAAYVVAAPSISPDAQNFIVNQAIDKLQAQHDMTTNPVLQALLQQAIEKLQNLLVIQRIASEVDMQRGFWDVFETMLGLDKVWPMITAMHGAVKENLLVILSKVFMAGKEAIANAKVILKDMVSELLSHGGQAQPIIQTYIEKLQAMLVSNIVGRSDERGIIETIGNVFGLGDIMSLITSLHSTVSDKFFVLLEQLIFKGKEVWKQCLPVIQQLHKDILAHLDQIPEYLAAAVAQLSSIINNHTSYESRMLDEQRGFWDVVSGFFGLDKVWSIITNIHGAAKDKFMAALTQIAFSGTSMWNQAKPIMLEMITELTSHATNGKPILESAAEKLQNLIAQHALNVIG